MPKLKEHDLQLWNLFVEVCGSRCNACGKSGVPLERGHLQRRADGGAGTFENLIPLCRPCNASFKGLTPDTRPEGWRDEFAKRFLAEFGLALRLKTGCPTYLKADPPKPGSNGSQVTENSGLLKWEDVQFVSSNVLYPTQKEADPLKPMSDGEGTALVEEITWGARAQITLPGLRRKGELIKAAKIHGAKRFKLAVREFLAQHNWPEHSGDPWAMLCDYFNRYLDAGLECERLAAKRLEAERVRQQQERFDARWNQWLQAAKLEDFPNNTFEDLQVIIAAKWAVRHGASPCEVTDAELDQVRAATNRFRVYQKKVTEDAKTELLKEKDELRKKLAQCVEWAKQYAAEDQAEYAESIKTQSDWIDRETSLETLRSESYNVGYLYDELDPARVPRDLDDF